MEIGEQQKIKSVMLGLLWMRMDDVVDLRRSGQMTSRNGANKICTAWLYLHEIDDCGNKRCVGHLRAFSPWIM